MSETGSRIIRETDLLAMTWGLTTMIQVIENDDLQKDRASCLRQLSSLHARILSILTAWPDKEPDIKGIAKLYEGYSIAMLTRYKDVLRPEEIYTITTPMEDAGYSQVLHLRISFKQLFDIQAAATLMGENVSDYLRKAISNDTQSVFYLKSQGLLKKGDTHG